MPIKNLQRRGLLTASKYKAAGKWHRAWTINDLVVIALAVDVSKHAGLSILDAIDLLSLIPADMHSALSIDRLVSKVLKVFATYVDPHGGAGEAEDRSWMVTQLDTLSLVMIDRSEVYAKRKGATPVLRRIGDFHDGSWQRSVDNDRVAEVSQESIGKTAGSMLELHLSRLGLSPIRTEFHLAIDINFEVPK